MTQEEIDRFQSWVLSTNAKILFNQMMDEITEPSRQYNSELFQIIDRIVLDRKIPSFYKTLPAGTRLFRARVIKPEEFSKSNGFQLLDDKVNWKTRGFNEANSVECPLGKSHNGRNNIEGVSYLYAAEDEATACAEVKSNLLDFISLAEFEIKEPLTYIDFSKDVQLDIKLSKEYTMNMATFMTLLMSQFTYPVYDEIQYRASQVVSDYIRKTGVDAFAYMSHYTQKSNFTVFHSHKWKIGFKNSRIIWHKNCDDVYLDYNNQVEIHAISPSPEINDCFYQETYVNMKKVLDGKG